jgi:6-phosphogluconate dehydrogenase
MLGRIPNSRCKTFLGELVMARSDCEIGMIGLGTMGRNLLLNMADHGFTVAGFDVDAGKVKLLATEAGRKSVQAISTLADLVACQKKPRVVMMLVPAGRIVDAVVNDLLPLLSPGDVIVDGGNSHFTDTDRRQKELAAKGLHFLGVGVSGGESGARHGPSIMPGGPREAWERVRPILEAVAAKASGDPCVVYLGPGSAGHYVKMVHNGIEYGLMQLLAESYDLLKRGLGYSDERAAAVFEKWNSKNSPLQGFLTEITARVLRQSDPKTGRPLVEMIRDEARQKGTGAWTSQSAADLQVPVPTIDMAVAMRDLSGSTRERAALRQTLSGAMQSPPPQSAEACNELGPTSAAELRRSQSDSGSRLLGQLGEALYAATIITFAQGLALLKAASAAQGYGLDLAAVARIWRGGCIIRAAILEDISAAYGRQADLPHLLADPAIAGQAAGRAEDLRAVVRAAVDLAIPAPAMMVSLAYLDAYASQRLPANLIQAQRDFFGAHTYERIDEPGTFHTEWS